MILRMEDIDATRCKPGFTQGILEDLQWLGILWDGPVRIQSEHMEDYRSALSQLSGSGLTYPCFCTRADVTAAAEAAHSPPDFYPGTCRGLVQVVADARIAAGEPYAVRLDVRLTAQRVGALEFMEQGQSHRVEPDKIGDFVVARKEVPTSYHLSVVVDDALQGVTLVTRGDDLFPATGPQRLLQAALGLPAPTYEHHRLVCGPDGRRFAKRDSSVTVQSLREQGNSAARVLEMAGAPAF